MERILVKRAYLSISKFSTFKLKYVFKKSKAGSKVGSISSRQ